MICIIMFLMTSYENHQYKVMKDLCRLHSKVTLTAYTQVHLFRLQLFHKVELLLRTKAGGGGGENFGLRSYGDVPTFRVDFLTQNILETGCKFEFELSAGPKRWFRPVENWVLAMSY